MANLKCCIMFFEGRRSTLFDRHFPDVDPSIISFLKINCTYMGDVYQEYC